MADLTPEQRARVEEAARDMAFKFGVLAGYEMDAIRAGLVPDQRANVRAGRKALQAAERALLATVEAVVGEARREAGEDAARWRALSDALHSAVGGGVEVNDERLVYDEPEPGQAVRVYRYPFTPIGFDQWYGDTLAEAVDQMRADYAPAARPENEEVG